jgi:hypothetical protein
VVLFSIIKVLLTGAVLFYQKQDVNHEGILRSNKPISADRPTLLFTERVFN